MTWEFYRPRRIDFWQELLGGKNVGGDKWREQLGGKSPTGEIGEKI
jgi:hypothetical protein